MSNFEPVEPVAKFRSENSREYIDRYDLKVNYKHAEAQQLY